MWPHIGVSGVLLSRLVPTLVSLFNFYSLVTLFLVSFWFTYVLSVFQVSPLPVCLCFPAPVIKCLPHLCLIVLPVYIYMLPCFPLFLTSLSWTPVFFFFCLSCQFKIPDCFLTLPFVYTFDRLFAEGRPLPAFEYDFSAFFVSLPQNY